MTRRKSKHNFSYNYPHPSPQYPGAIGTIQANQTNTAALVSYINSINQFQTWTRDQTYENLYINESTVASAVDAFAVMVSEAYNYIDAKYTNKSQSFLKKIKEKLLLGDKNLTEQMTFEANEIASDMNIEEVYEAYAAIAMMNGNTLLEKKKNLSLSVIPNARATIIDRLDRIGQASKDINDLITEANYLVIDEGLETERILNKDQFFIIKYRETPLLVEDSKGRYTFGIYSISPLRRAIIPVWYKNSAIANDALWRARAVPREHHQLAADAFSTKFYQGQGRNSVAQIEAAQTAALNALSSYKNAMTYQAPDQMYITLDNVTIDTVEPKSTSYMRANELIEQMNQEIYSAMNLPQSVVKGVSGSNYASELIISSYASTKVKQMAKKISNVLLTVIKERLLVINSKFPVDQLDIKISFTLANSRLENYKIAQVMASMGTYYANEIREETDHEPFPEDLNVLVDTANKLTPATDEMTQLGQLGEAPTNPNNPPAVNNGGQQLSSDGSVNYPTTTHSAATQPTDSADAIYKTSTTPKK